MVSSGPLEKGMEMEMVEMVMFLLFSMYYVVGCLAVGCRITSVTVTAI